MHLCFKIVKFLLQSMSLYMFWTLFFHHQEPSTNAHADSGYRVILCWLRPPAQYQQNSAGGRNQDKITR
jgi:hypothetical protein